MAQILEVIAMIFFLLTQVVKKWCKGWEGLSPI